MTKNNKIVYFLISLVFFLIFDLYFSNLILNQLRFNFPENSFLELLFVKNTGAAFSILENYSWFLIAFSIIAIILISSYIIRNVEKLTTFACYWTAMLVAGISCNLYERIAYGYVRDFLNLKFISFPVFNISDIFICIGVIAIILIIIKNKYIKK